MERYRRPPTPEQFTVFMREAMKVSGLTVDEIAHHLGVGKVQVLHYCGRTRTPQLPALHRWALLVDLLPFPPHLLDAMEVVDREYETYDYGLRDIPERLGAKIPKGAPPKVVATGWTDCGHDDWRPGVWLDPFAVTDAS